MNHFKWSAITVIGLASLVACPTDPQLNKTITDTNTLTEANVWKDPIPSDATIVSLEEFQKHLASGETALVSTASLEKQRADQQKQYQDDITFLQGLPQKTPQLQALLDKAAATPKYEADQPVKLANGKTVTLLGIGITIHDEVEAYKRSQSVENTLENYTLSYSLLPENLKTKLPTPESLKGKSKGEIKTALDQLEALLRANPTIIKTSRPESGLKTTEANHNSGSIRAQDAVVTGNGADNDGNCAQPKSYAGTFWYPLKNFISPIKDQGRRGTCWAFTAVGALESRERVQKANQVDLSEQFLNNKYKREWTQDDYKEGGSYETVLNQAVSFGQALPPEGSWTYNRSLLRVKNGEPGDKEYFDNACDGYSGTCGKTSHQSKRECTSYKPFGSYCSDNIINFTGPGVASSNTVQIWKNGESFNLQTYRSYLANGQVLLGSFRVYTSFADAKSRNEDRAGEALSYSQNDTTPGKISSHAVQIVGFISNEEIIAKFGGGSNIGGGGYFIIKNSWGCNTGDGGFYYLPADYVSANFYRMSVLNFDTQRSNAWNIEQANPGSVAPAIQIIQNPSNPSNTLDLRVEYNLADSFRVSHPEAKTVNLSVTSDKDGSLYNGSWISEAVVVPSSLKKSFGTPGKRTISLLATYGTFQTTANFSVNVVNSPPTLTLTRSSAIPRTGENYPITAVIKDKNELDTTKLCTTTTWSVTAPDTLSATTGCQVNIKFGTTGNRQVKATTRDSDGESSQSSITVTVAQPAANPFPRIKTSGVYARDFNAQGNFKFCGGVIQAFGAAIDLRQKGCQLLNPIGGNPPAPDRYYAAIEVENPSAEVLTYNWTLYVTDPSTGESILYDDVNSKNPSFNMPQYGLLNVKTQPCRVTVNINAPDPLRSKLGIPVWAGTCTFLVGKLG
jgi:C1A family cysteine protease